MYKTKSKAFLCFTLLLAFLTISVSSVFSAHEENDQSNSCNPKNMSTEALFAFVLDSPDIHLLAFYEDSKVGYDQLLQKSEAFSELMQREDLQAVLTKQENRTGLQCNFFQALLFKVLGLHAPKSSPTYASVTINTPSGFSVSALLCTSDFSNEEIATMNAEVASVYPDAIYHRSATGRYNCHSYAWYDSSSTNSYWLNYPSTLKSDCYHSTSTCSAGDILVYYYNGTEQHSAVILSTDGTLAGTVLLSKWGSYGLYEHAATNCPYYLPNYSDFSLFAYTPCIHDLYTSPLNSSSHRVDCSDCLYYIASVPHTITYSPVNQYQHRRLCTDCAYSQLESHSINPMTGRCYQCGFKGQTVDPNKIILDYPVKAYIRSRFDSVLEGRLIQDEAAIHSFCDMINHCTLRDATKEELESHPYSPKLTGYWFQIGGASFFLDQDGYFCSGEAYQILYDDDEPTPSNETNVIQILEGFDVNLFTAFVNDQYVNANEAFEPLANETTQCHLPVLL